jgi:hypothetical protein
VKRSRSTFRRSTAVARIELGPRERIADFVKPLCHRRQFLRQAGGHRLVRDDRRSRVGDRASTGEIPDGRSAVPKGSYIPGSSMLGRDGGSGGLAARWGLSTEGSVRGGPDACGSAVDVVAVNRAAPVTVGVAARLVFGVGMVQRHQRLPNAITSRASRGSGAVCELPRPSPTTRSGDVRAGVGGPVKTGRTGESRHQPVKKRVCRAPVRASKDRSRGKPLVSARAGEGIRTPDLRFTRALLYLAELPRRQGKG